jgi:hypothetical protein
VTIEGGFSLERPDFERHIRAIAHRYLGPEQGERYIASTRAERDLDAEVLVRLTPERWLSADYGK